MPHHLVLTLFCAVVLSFSVRLLWAWWRCGREQYAQSVEARSTYNHFVLLYIYFFFVYIHHTHIFFFIIYSNSILSGVHTFIVSSTEHTGFHKCNCIQLSKEVLAFTLHTAWDVIPSKINPLPLRYCSVCLFICVVFCRFHYPSSAANQNHQFITNIYL